MILSKFFRRDPYKGAVTDLYTAIVNQARQPDFYLRGEVPDTVDGRFEMIVLHTYLVLRRLKREGEDMAGLSQALFDQLFADMDQSLREIGVGDLSVGKRIKEMATLFYGRVAAYDTALDGGEETLEDALRRNHYRTVEGGPSEAAVSLLAEYVRRNSDAMAAEDVSGLVKGQVRFQPFEGEA
ncbi:ubiquinol-cytochrome C chaperone family protein [Sneathiella chinensis]|uniref:Ubiquinol-cytochrome c chaperone n=1 Tax=Sneathiella chinensis TaxID=349750 RepID=A0ABQ5U782_9PROT|nr:ubiquinol-cytochrome C chaperone family protein [Sneathiella chinensis]GLQ07651.1 ubiquinol-cytochrome c chaperone [Sneathiella chinensis]